MFLRSRISVAVIWGMAALSLWIGFPITACQCANGGIKLFCDAHTQNLAALGTGPDQTTLAKGDCCQHAKAAANHDCSDQSRENHVQLSSQGCTPISNSSEIAPVPPSTHVTPDQAVALFAPAVVLSLHSSALAALEPAKLDTGPPVDLVITLHCLLI